MQTAGASRQAGSVLAERCIGKHDLEVWRALPS